MIIKPFSYINSNKNNQKLFPNTFTKYSTAGRSVYCHIPLDKPFEKFMTQYALNILKRLLSKMLIVLI